MIAWKSRSKSAPRLAGGRHRSGQGGQQRLVVAALEAVAVGAQRAGLRQALKAGERRQGGINANVIDVADATPADRLERQQREHRAQRRDLTRAG